MKAFVDADVCMGCGICEAIAPRVFRLESEPYAIVIVDVVPAGDEGDVRDAMDQCPEQAISIEE
jgi:ferredoxin